MDSLSNNISIIPNFDINDNFDFENLDEQLNITENGIRSEMIEEGKVLFNLSNENASKESLPLAMDKKGVSDFFKSKPAEAKNAKFSPIFLPNRPTSSGNQQIYAHPAIKQMIQTNGLIIQQNGKQTKIPPHQITVIAFTPGQLQRINMAVTLAFKNLKEADKEESEPISKKKITYLPNVKLPIAKEKFDLLKSQAKEQIDAAERKKDHQTALKLNEQTTLEKYRHDQKLKKERKESIKKQHIITKKDVKKSDYQAENRKIDISKEFLK